MGRPVRAHGWGGDTQGVALGWDGSRRLALSDQGRRTATRRRRSSLFVAGVCDPGGVGLRQGLASWSGLTEASDNGPADRGRLGAPWSQVLETGCGTGANRGAVGSSSGRDLLVPSPDGSIPGPDLLNPSPDGSIPSPVLPNPSPDLLNPSPVEGFRAGDDGIRGGNMGAAVGIWRCV